MAAVVVAGTVCYNLKQNEVYIAFVWLRGREEDTEIVRSCFEPSQLHRVQYQGSDRQTETQTDRQTVS